MKTKTYVFILLLISIIINEIHCFKCGTDKLKLKFKKINTTEIGNKRRLVKEFTPIKIGVDYNSFIRPSSLSMTNFENIKYIIEDTIKEFQRFLKVQHEDIDITLLKNFIIESCDLRSIGNGYRNYLIDNDVIIFPIFDNSLGSEAIAAASACLIANNYRPIAGVLYLNPELSFDIKNTKTFMKNTLLHEITHILIFNPLLLEKLNMITKKNSVSYVHSTNVVSKARQHFNCPSITGVPLENQGGVGSAGSHWEARYMLGDYMISTDYIDVVLSDISIALFEDSGFYEVEYYSGGLFKYGKNKGCDFINKKCLINANPLFEDEFCNTPQKPMCSPSRTFKAECAIYQYKSNIPSQFQYFSNPTYGGFMPVDYCPVAMSSPSEKDYYPSSCKIGSSTLTSEYGEIIGDNSFCFISSLLPSTSRKEYSSQAICYQVECDENKKKIIVHVGSSTITCPTNGGNVINPKGFKGVLNCPKYIDICGFEGNIICNEMFDCLKKKVKTKANTNTESDSNTYDLEDDDFIIIHHTNSSVLIKNSFFYYILLYSLIFFNHLL